MIDTNVTIREARREDSAAIRALHLMAFAESERLLVAKLAEDLLVAETVPPVMSLLAVAGDEVTGHVAFSPVADRSTGEPLGYLLAPLAVSPGQQGHGIGAGLVRAGIGRLEARGVGLILVYGDPAYYGRFGFRADAATGYLPPFPLQHPSGWQALVPAGGPARLAPVAIDCLPVFDEPALW